MSEFNAYIGVQFKPHGRDPNGWDCWGLVHYILREHFDICVPSYDEDYESLKDKDHLQELIKGQMGPWDEISLDLSEAGDVLLLRMMGRPVHVGLVVARGIMLHVEMGIETCIEDYTGIWWKNRVIGAYRYVG